MGKIKFKLIFKFYFFNFDMLIDIALAITKLSTIIENILTQELGLVFTV